MLPTELIAEIDSVGLFRGLAGRWRQARTLSPGGAYNGEAVLAPIDATRLHYEEQGVLTLADGQRLAASRRYVFALEGGQIGVYFDEQPLRLFHRLDFARIADGSFLAKARHLCGTDDYLSTYAITSEDAFAVTHRVAGPRKAYLMSTDYARSSVATPR